MSVGSTYQCAMYGDWADVDTDAIASPICVDLCREDAAKRMSQVRYPLPECDADARFDTWDDLKRFVAMSGHDSPTALAHDDLEKRLLTNAVVTAR